jgi:hypothetical protein
MKDKLKFEFNLKRLKKHCERQTYSPNKAIAEEHTFILLLYV